MMLHLFLKKGDWFPPKRFGYGAGLPTAWQGWALIAAWFAALAGLRALDHTKHSGGHVAAIVLGITITGLFLLIAARRTRGGWKWRWGERD